tara:strand:+ start:464 stop:661 length:198 start_codon:yes stop_codon:yes gene_type:complete
MCWLEFYEPPLTIPHNDSGRFFIANKYARVRGVPVLFDDWVIVWDGDPFSSHNGWGVMVLPLIDD